MQTELTLHLETQLIDLAKEYASSQGKSVSKMVADYFMLIDKIQDTHHTEIAPITQSLKGSLGKIQVDKTDYEDYLEGKYL